MARTRSVFRQANALLCIVSVLILALAPVLPMAGGRTSGVDLSAYALPDGTLLVICGLGRNGDDGSEGAPLCPLCTIAATLGLPPVDLGAGIVWLVHVAASVEPGTRGRPQRFAAAFRARAPPVRG